MTPSPSNDEAEPAWVFLPTAIRAIEALFARGDATLLAVKIALAEASRPDRGAADA